LLPLPSCEIIYFEASAPVASLLGPAQSYLFLISSNKYTNLNFSPAIDEPIEMNPEVLLNGQPKLLNFPLLLVYDWTKVAILCF
jgi:hypothetical protein